MAAAVGSASSAPLYGAAGASRAWLAAALMVAVIVVVGLLLGVRRSDRSDSTGRWDGGPGPPRESPDGRVTARAAGRASRPLWWPEATAGGRTPTPTDYASRASSVTIMSIR